jgi:RNA polymerase sigma-70 factor (ECF subfamily)
MVKLLVYSPHYWTDYATGMTFPGIYLVKRSFVFLTMKLFKWFPKCYQKHKFCSGIDLMEQNDDELLRLLAHDLYQHYGLVVAHFQFRLFTFARRLTGSFSDAEDIVQEAFVSAYVSLENYPPQRILSLKLRPWLYRVTLNVYTHYARGSRLYAIPLNLSENSPLLNIEDNIEDSPESLCERQEQRQELENLVSSLPERYRVAVTCYFFECLNYQEIADLLDQPIGTVKSTVSRGVRLLRTMCNSSQLVI